MLATCRVNGWDLATYRDRGPPPQRAMAETIADLAGEPVAATAVDGCGAPVMAISLAGLVGPSAARTAGPDTAEGTVAAAIRGCPDYLGGTRRDVTALIRGTHGAIAKDGAESVYAVGLADGRHRPARSRTAASAPARSSWRGCCATSASSRRPTTGSRTPGARPRRAGRRGRGRRALGMRGGMRPHEGRLQRVARSLGDGRRRGRRGGHPARSSPSSASPTTTAPSRSRRWRARSPSCASSATSAPVLDEGAPVLVVSQFTLYADTRKAAAVVERGRARPGRRARRPAGRRRLRARGVEVATGRFGVHMEVGLVNDGPVTIVLDV